MPGVSPQAKSILGAQSVRRRQPHKWWALLGFKGTEGPRSAGPESFKVKALHLVSVLIDHRHIISPVQGLICPPNQHLLSTAAVVCWRGGNWKGLIIPGRCESEPIFCSLLSCLLVDFVFSDTRFPKHRGIWWALTVGGKNIFKDKSEIENATLKKCKLYFIYLVGFFFFHKNGRTYIICRKQK